MMTEPKTPIQQARERAGLSRAKAAAALDISERTLYRWEQDQRVRPLGTIHLRALADLYGVPLADLEEAA